MKNKRAALLSFSIALAIILGALAAHTLKSKILPEQLESFKTGAFYHLVQSIALLVLVTHERLQTHKTVFYLIATGMFLFSGSIYLLSTKELLGFESIASVVGPITPVGGVLMILGWMLLGIQLLRSKSSYFINK
jgi:uncharacterized membrane protein YgdD (TMEM256/DUF423 family)